MADEKTATPATPTPDSIPITDPTASAPIPIDLNPEYDPAEDKRAPFLKVNPNLTGPTVEAAPEPSLLERAKKVVTEGIPRYSTRTPANPKYGQEQFLAPEEGMTSEEQRQAPAAAAALEAAGGLTSPATVGTVAATAGLGEAGIIPKVLSGIFAGQIAADVYDQYPALKNAVNRAQNAKTQQEHDDAFADAQRIATHMGADTLMGLLAAKHGAEGAKEILDKTTGSGVPDQASTFKAPKVEAAPEPEETHPEMNRDTVKKLQALGYSNQHITNFNIGEIRDILKNNTPAAEHPVSKPTAGPDPDKFAEAGGKLVGPSPTAKTSSGEPSQAAISKALAEPLAEPDRIAQLKQQASSTNSLESKAAISLLQHVYGETFDPVEDLIMSDKVGGKKVRGATPAVEPTVTAQRAPATSRGLVEKSTGDEQVDAHIKAAGATPAGNMGGLAMFHDPKTGSTLAIKSEDVTPESVQQHLVASRKEFGIAPDPDAFAEHGGKLIGQQPKAAPTLGEHQPLSKALIEKHGTTTDPLATGFILSDGQRVPLTNDHEQAINQLTPRDKPINPKERLMNMVNFINDEQAVRTRYRTGRGGDEVVFSVSPNGVTPEQIDQMRQAVGKMGRNGNVIIERTDVNSENMDDAVAHKEFARPSDVEPMLQKIGAHPEQQDLIAHELQTPLKETYGMEVTDSDGKSHIEKVNAHSSKQALATVVKKFPDASEWRLANMPEGETPAREYSVPAGKIQKMIAVAGRPEIHTIRHELGHFFAGARAGLKQKGMVSASHPELNGRGRAGLKWDGRGLYNANGVAPEKMAGIVQSLMGGIAADEVFNDYPREQNHNFAISQGGDGAKAYHFLQAAGFSHDDALDFMHKAIDDIAEYLKHPVVSAMIHENAGVREQGLSKQFHYSPERLDSIFAETNRRMKNAETTGQRDNGAIDRGRDQDRPENVARTEGIAAETTPTQPAETEESLVAEDKIPPKVSPNKKLQESAQKYAKAQGMDKIDHSPVAVDSARAKEIADLYDKAQHDPENPRVKAAYNALKSETLAQFHHLRNDLGLKFEPQEKDPYNSAGEMMGDVKQNNRLKVFTGSSTGEDHPLSEIAPGTGGQTYNTIFRWVHDAMGHAAGGNDFSEAGEKSATEAHAQMYSDAARPAMRAETEGQTSWFFHNPEVESGAKKPGAFAEQKATLLPDETLEEKLKKGVSRDNPIKTEIPLSKISVSESAFTGASRNISRGAESKTAGPVQLVYNPRNGQFLVEDGMHRIVQANRNNDATIQATIHSSATDAANVAEGTKMNLEPTSWHELAGDRAQDDEAGGIDPRTGKSDSKGMGTEIMPELRQPLDHAPTAQDFKNFYDQHKEIFDQHPELRVGWDNKSAVEGGHEINVGAVGPDAARVAKKLDQKSSFNIGKGEVVPTGGSGLRTSFPNYPIEDRIKDLTNQHYSDRPGFEHLSKDIYDHLEPDERKYVEGNKTLQRNVMAQYHKIAPSVAETTNAMQAGAALGGWWQRYIDTFHGLLDQPVEPSISLAPLSKTDASKINNLSVDERGRTEKGMIGPTGKMVVAPTDHDEIAQTGFGEESSDELLNKGGIRFASYGPTGYVEIKSKSAATVQRALQVIQNLPNTNVEFDFHNGVDDPFYAHGSLKQVEGKINQWLNGASVEQIANTIGPSHAEVLKQWHAALSANKSVQDANNLAWHSYADWLDAGKPTDRKSINDIVLKNGAQPEGSGKKGNAAISDTLGKRGKIIHEGIDTSKLLNLVNSPEMRGERPFAGDVFNDDAKNPLMGKGEGYRKVPSMGATVAGKGNLNRLVIDTHIADFYGQDVKGTAARYIADSAHMRQAAEALGLKGGEGQEQLWGTVLGLKTLLKEGLTPEEAGGKLNSEVINKIGKDYAEVIANDPEITEPGGVLDRLKEKYGIGVGSAGASTADRQARSASASEGEPASRQAAVDPSLTTESARRIRGQISDSKIKKPAAESDDDTAFEFGANAPLAGSFKSAPKKSKSVAQMSAVDLIKALSGLSKPGSKK